VSVYTLASATQDIAIDAYTIGIVDAGQEGPANAMRNTGYRAGMLLAAGLFFLPRWIGWDGALGAAAGLHALMAGAVYLTPRVEVPAEARREMWPALRRWLGRQGALPVFGFVLLYRVGDLAMGPMVKPFWVERGFSDEEIGLVSVTLGIAAMIAGSWLAAGLVSPSGQSEASPWHRTSDTPQPQPIPRPAPPRSTPPRWSNLSARAWPG
jgi:PAT family beta-lactamase induction signal transducer AmpG